MQYAMRVFRWVYTDYLDKQTFTVALESHRRTLDSAQPQL